MLDPTLLERSEARCELCGATAELAPFDVAPHDDGHPDHVVVACATCRAQLDGTTDVVPDHWRCLAESMWLPVPPVQVVAYRMLTRLRDEGWAHGLLDSLVLDDDTLAWARQGLDEPAADAAAAVRHVDAHGAVLADGDTVVLIKDLEVKGAGFTAKRGTAVRGISLVPDNPEHLEGRVNNQRIVILTKFVKKS